jgi:eukaryotic-like serine/threonine-protein kinase
LIEVGQTLGNYDVTAKLGEGGMGVVFLGEHPVIGSKVAIKAIHPHFARDADIVTRFMNEAKAVNKIGHDHIVDITDFGNTPAGDFYFIMEYLQGDSLAALIERQGHLAPARALTIAVQITDALSASHEYGVVHRDLKPDNVYLIARDGNEDFVKVLDFGLAKLTLGDDAPTHQTRSNRVMGTPYYMAPEQCQGRTDLDHRADIYALGVMLFEMLTGMVPFGGHGYGDILVKQITVAAPTARSLVPELSPALDVILFRALAKDPDLRFQTMTELREALLDPEGYASSVVAPGAHEDATVRVRVAMPMARKELDPLLSRPAAAFTPRIARVHAPSTLHDGVGEVADDVAQREPKRHRVRNVLLVGVAVLTGMGVAGVKDRQKVVAVLAAAVAPKKPVTVVVTFNSDPNGASVAQADGVVLGVTPLLTEVVFGNTALEYVIRKEGYFAETAFIVPNRPSPFFAMLEQRAPTAPVVVTALAVEPPSNDAATTQ